MLSKSESMEGMGRLLNSAEKSSKPRSVDVNGGSVDGGGGSNASVGSGIDELGFWRIEN